MFEQLRRASLRAACPADARPKLSKSHKCITPQLLGAIVRRTPEALAADIQKRADGNGQIVALTQRLDIWSKSGLRAEMGEFEVLFAHRRIAQQSRGPYASCHEHSD